MEQFTVPQFIDVEDKIFGPVSVRQFLILLAGGGLGFIAYKVADFSLFIFIAVIDVLLTGTFAFVKVSGVSFHLFLLNIIQTMKRSHLRVWNHERSLAELKAELQQPQVKKVTETVFVKQPLGHAPLAQLALIVDTGGVYKGE